MPPKPSRWLLTIVLLALALRLAYSLSQNPAAPFADTGGDSAWYLENGYKLLTGADVSQLSPPPLYLVFIGLPQLVLSQEAAVIAIRIAQALMSVATCYFAYRLARALAAKRPGGAQNERAGLIVAGVLAVSPVFILEAAQILTETIYVFLIAAGITAYVELMTQPSPLLAPEGGRDVAQQCEREARTQPDAPPRRVVWLLGLTGTLLGLATLTRAVLLLFPLGLAFHLLLVYRRAGLKRAAWLLLVYGVVVSTWTVYNLARWNRFVVAGDGLAANIYLGAAGWAGPNEVDQRLAEQLGQPLPDEADSPERQEAYQQAASEAIRRDVPGYLRRRVGELVGAYLQPHGTVAFPGESLRELAAAWWRDDRTPGGLLALTRGDAFWQKLTLYVFHYAGLAFGFAGMWLCRRRWRVALPMLGFIVYTTLVHLALLALPRYIFPTEVFWWVFAGAAIHYGLSAINPRRRPRTPG